MAKTFEFLAPIAAKPCRKVATLVATLNDATLCRSYVENAKVATMIFGKVATMKLNPQTTTAII